MKTIVAALDFSENALAALDWAETIARSHRARLVLCHALAPAVPAPAAPEFVALPPEVYEAEEKRARELLEEHAAKRRTDDLEVETRMRLGPASQTLLDLADGAKADLTQPRLQVGEVLLSNEGLPCGGVNHCGAWQDGQEIHGRIIMGLFP